LFHFVLEFCFFDFVELVAARADHPLFAFGLVDASEGLGVRGWGGTFLAISWREFMLTNCSNVSSCCIWRLKRDWAGIGDVWWLWLGRVVEEVERKMCGLRRFLWLWVFGFDFGWVSMAFVGVFCVFVFVCF
jgi:hypothetical protein